MKSIGKLNHVPLSRYLELQKKLREKRREVLLFLEHLPGLTAGINYNIANLLVTKEFLIESNIDLSFLPRGGDFTAHEPGQLVIYPHIDLKKRGIKISSFADLFLLAIRESIKEVWGIELITDKTKPGLYLLNEGLLAKEHNSDSLNRRPKKLVSIGIYCKSFFSSFGAAINISNDLKHFKMIHPCGENADSIVNLQMLGGNVLLEDIFIKNFQYRFLTMIENSPSLNSGEVGDHC